MEITQYQKDKMEHALGLNYKKRPWRNMFYCAADDETWNDLVNKGLAVKRKGWDEESAYFKLTFEGARMIYTKPMSKKYFEGLR